MAALTAKQEMFVREYLVDLNATQAAIRAGFSAKTAEQQGHQLLKKTSVADAIQKAMDERSARTEITADRVLQELAKIGFADIRRLFTPGGNLLPVNDLEADAAACLASIEITTRKVRGGKDDEVEQVSKVRLWDKRAALVDLGRHLKLFTDKLEHSADDDLVSALMAARNRAA